MPAQVIISLDGDGRPFAEAPGRNGMRQRIQLPADFAQRNPDLMIELMEQQAQAQAIAHRVTQAASAAAEVRQAQELERLRRTAQQRHDIESGYRLTPQQRREVRQYVTQVHPLTAHQVGLAVHARPIGRRKAAQVGRQLTPDEIGI